MFRKSKVWLFKVQKIWVWPTTSCHILLWIQLEFCLQYTYYIVNVGKYIVDENVEYMFLCKVWPKNKLGILILSDTLNKYIYNASNWKRTMTNGIDLCWKLSLIFFHSVSYGHSKQQDYSPLSFCLLSMANGHVFTSSITKSCKLVHNQYDCICGCPGWP